MDHKIYYPVHLHSLICFFIIISLNETTDNTGIWYYVTVILT